MRLLLLAVPVALLTMAACGPREGRASDPPAPGETRQAATLPAETQIITAVEPASTPATKRDPIHPMAMAAAKTHMDGLLAKRKVLDGELHHAQSMITRHTMRYGEPWSPDPDPDRPWGKLIGRALETPPVNPFSPRAVASHIVVVDADGVTGATVSPKTAGWVWNESSRTLDAARDSAAYRASEREEHRRLVRNTYGPHLSSTLRTLRGQIALFSLYETPLWGPGEVAAVQWSPLLEAGYIFDAPDNPLSPRDVARLVVETTVRGADGQSVSPEIAGWVWNSADRTLFAAGYRED